MLDQVRAGIPGRVFGRPGDVVALEAGNRHRGEALDTDALGELGIVGDDLVVDLLAVVDEVHLVHREHQVPDADQVAEI